MRRSARHAIPMDGQASSHLRRLGGLIVPLAIALGAVGATPGRADDVDFLGCGRRMVTLHRGPTWLSVCYTSEVPRDRHRYAVETAARALPLIEALYGTPYAYDSMRIELGHNHADGGGGLARLGGGT